MMGTINPFNSTPSTIKTISWPRGLLIGVIVLFVFLLAAYFGLVFYNKSQDKNLANLDQQIALLKTSFSEDKQSEIINFENRINNLSNLLKNHRYPTNLLAALEKATHPKIYFTNFDFDDKTSVLSLDGVALSYTAISEEMTAFSQVDGVRNVVFKNLKTDQKNQTTFSLDLTIDSKLIKP